ncbi:MAG: DUF4197 domain-containing protein [Bacteroidota bacterium]
MKNARLLILACLLTLTTSASFAQMNLLKKAKDAASGKGTGLSSEDIANGLKEALSQGASKGSDQASKLDGYLGNPQIKIPFPPEVQNVEQKLRSVGMGYKVDEFVVSLNRAAEDAASSSKPIFVKAITSMNVQDAMGILRGEKNSATQYLKRTTTPDLTAAFSPVIQTSLDKVNATKLYADLITSYNKIPLVKKVNPNLAEYATQKAIDGMFTLVEGEEANIRANPAARTSELLKKVFK